MDIPVALVQPTLTAPAAGAIVCSGVWTTYGWQAVAGATNYRIQWSASNTFTSPTEMFTADASVQQALTGRGTSYWRVHASNNCGSGPWSATRTVQRAIVPGAPSPLDPAAGAVVCSGVVQTYCWTSAAGAHLYRIQWDDDPAFGSPVETTTFGSCADWILTGSGSRSWRVRAESPCGASAWSSARTVVLETGIIPGTPALIGPDDGALACVGAITEFRWNEVTGADLYRVQWDEDPSFAIPDETSLAGTWAGRSFESAGEIVWRVRAESICGPGGWTQARSILCVAPTAIRCTQVSFLPDGRLRVVWEDAGCPLGYTVEVTDNPGNPAGWSAIPPAGQWPVQETGWTGDFPGEPDRAFFRVKAQ